MQTARTQALLATAKAAQAFADTARTAAAEALANAAWLAYRGAASQGIGA